MRVGLRKIPRGQWTVAAREEVGLPQPSEKGGSWSSEVQAPSWHPAWAWHVFSEMNKVQCQPSWGSRPPKKDGPERVTLLCHHMVTGQH